MGELKYPLIYYYFKKKFSEESVDAYVGPCT